MFKVIIFLSLLFLILPLLSENVEATNPNLFVSAENSLFDNHFSGSMVIEVVVNDVNIRDTDQGKGEPNVTINGKDLRMVQSTDGQWYAYFANIDKAKIADQIVLNNGIGAEGESLDFGVFCSSDTSASVLGVSFSGTEGIAIPRSGGIASSTNGNSAFNTCTGSPGDTTNLNNVVRNPKSVNTNPNIPAGQIGINPNTWPIIQLYSFNNDVTIQYDKAGGTQTVDLDYDEIPNISLNLDRTHYPNNAEVFVTIDDIQLNQDPTDEDSWTFQINSPEATFYQAFTETGSDAANGGVGLINLVPHLSSLGFEDNGKLTLNLGSIAELKTNSHQPNNFVTDGTNTYFQIVTLVESGPHSGIFENFDFNDESTVGILNDAPRGESAIIEYNSESSSIISDTFTASISLDAQGSQLQPGQKASITYPLTLNAEKFVLPKYKETTDVVLTGKLDDYKQGTQIFLTLVGPDQSSEQLSVYATKKGEYNAAVTLHHYSLSGIYTITVDYFGSPVGLISFEVIKNQVPEWIKNNAKWWSSNAISDSEFIGGIEHLIKEKIIIIPESVYAENTTQEIPDWIKNTANWWSDGLVSDDEFVAALEFLVKNSIIRI